ncbi:MAG: glycosyltransferase [Bacteroidota bacterium]
MEISIIIPTLNEEELLAKTIEHTLKFASSSSHLEIIVVDAGSTDQTLQSVQNLPVTVYSKPEFSLKKSESLNFGIEKSNGSVLLFLDADTLLPECFDELILEKLANPKVVGGGFAMKFDRADWRLKTLTLINWMRYTLWKTFYGDQAIYCRKEAAVAIGGFSATLMEAAYFCRALKKHGKLAVIYTPVISSSRRFYEHGILTVTWFDIRMWGRFVLGLDLESFRERYWKTNLSDG